MIIQQFNFTKNSNELHVAEGNYYYIIPQVLADQLLKNSNPGFIFKTLNLFRRIQIDSYFDVPTSVMFGVEYFQSLRESLRLLKSTVIEDDIRLQFNGRKYYKYILKACTDYAVIVIKKESFIDVLNYLPVEIRSNNFNYLSTISEFQVNQNALIKTAFELYKIGEISFDKFIYLSILPNELNETRCIKYNRNVGRVYSPLSKLAPIIREFVHIHQSYFSYIKISNSLIVFLAATLINLGFKIDQEFIELINTGNLLKHIMKEAEKEQIAFETIVNDEKYGETKCDIFSYAKESDVLKLFVKTIIYKKHSPNSSMISIFNKLFPLTSKAISHFNKNYQSNALAEEIQKNEALVILRTVPDSQYFTNHNAIYVINANELPNLEVSIALKIYNLSKSKIITRFETHKCNNQSNTYQVSPNENPQDKILLFDYKNRKLN